jgi:hypothetical protein
MLHTSDQANAYIWEKFRQVFISERSAGMIDDLEPVLKLLEHRPINLTSESHKQMEKQREERLKGLKSKYPGLNLDKYLK